MVGPITPPLNQDDVAATGTTTKICIDGQDEEYIHTTMTQNFIARSAIISDPKYFEMKGRSILHSNVQIKTTTHTTQDIPCNIPIRMGRYCHVKENTIFHIPTVLPKRYHGIDDVKNTTGTTNTTNMIIIGSYTMIGQDCTILGMIAIGSYCRIGNNVTIGDKVIIKDNCIIESNTYIPPHAVIPPFTYCYNSNKPTQVMKGTVVDHAAAPITRRHTRLIMDTSLPPGITTLFQEQAIATYDVFVQQYKQNELQKKY